MRKKKWKCILEYILGAGSLAAVIAIAWFVPEWYAKWQEQYLLGNVTVSSRGEIQFLDTDSLDVISRLKLMEEADGLKWVGYDNISFDVNDKIKEYRKIVGEWCRLGLLPAFTENMVAEDLMIYIWTFAEMDEKSLIPFFVCRFDDGSDAVTVMADAEKNMIYYISVSGCRAEEYMAERLGYESADSLYKAVSSDIFLAQKEDLSVYDFAGICGAESASVKAGDGNLNLDAELKFDSFEGHAYRRMVYTDASFGSYGICVYFEMKNQSIPRQISEIMSAAGLEEEEAWLEDWLGIWQAENYDPSEWRMEGAFAKE